MPEHADTKGTVLICEDESIVAEDIRTSLERLGYTVTSTASSGEEALRKVEAEPPELVMMDIVLKGRMDGIEAAVRLRERFGIQVVFLTAYTNEEIVDRAKAAAPLGYVIKPFKERELKIVLEMAFYKARMEKKLKESEEQRLQAAKMAAVGQLASGLAHEINNPLGAILLFTQALLRRQKADGALAGPLGSIEREALRCKGLIENLLVFSRRSAPGRREPCDPVEAVKDALALVRVRSKVSIVEIVTEFEPRPPRITANKSQIQQVLINLCNNALDAMPEGGTLTVRARASLSRDGRAELQVRDTGAGIPEEIRARMFEPFYTTKEPGKGTGLGLSIAHEIVRNHGGSIEVESEPGKGTTFTLDLPAGVPAEGAVAVRAGG